MCPADVCSLWHWPGHGNCPGSTHIYLALCHSLAGSFFWDMLPIMKLSCIKTTINEVVSLLVILVPISLVFIGYIHLTVVIVHYSYASTAHLKPRSENSEEQALLLSVNHHHSPAELCYLQCEEQGQGCPVQSCGQNRFLTHWPFIKRHLSLSNTCAHCIQCPPKSILHGLFCNGICTSCFSMLITKSCFHVFQFCPGIFTWALERSGKMGMIFKKAYPNFQDGAGNFVKAYYMWLLYV